VWLESLPAFSQRKQLEPSDGGGFSRLCILFDLPDGSVTLNAPPKANQRPTSQCVPSVPGLWELGGR
jgi:hypothetical protein